MHAVSLFVPIVFGLALSVAPDLPKATSRPAAAMVTGDSGDAEYQALQRRADLALNILRQARERRLAQLSANGRGGVAARARRSDQAPLLADWAEDD
jgi:hypothetical protein